MVLEISRTDFSFYTHEELRQLCQVEINNSQTFSSVERRPMKGGLYDLAMGPTDRDTLCTTCGLNEQFCPGHLGYINLRLPLYHPLLLKQLKEILLRCCFYCSKFRLNAVKRFLIWKKFQLLQAGLLHEAIDVLEQPYKFLPNREEKMRIPKKKEEMEENGEEEEEEEEVDDVIHLEDIPLINKTVMKLISKKAKLYGYETPEDFLNANLFVTDASIHAERMETIKEFWDASGKATRQCQNCEAPGIKIVLYDNVSFHAERPEKIPKSSLNKEFTLAPEMRVLDQLNNKRRIPLNPSDVEKFVKQLWKNEIQIFSSIYAFNGACSDIFFLHIIPVMPNKFRPMMKVGGNTYENAMNSFLSKIIDLNNALINVLEQSNGEYTSTANQCVAQMQRRLNTIIDSSLVSQNKMYTGIRQSLERKEGLFRKHLMGKRVNYAGRSVILPDPYIGTGEVAVPKYFAMKLTYPEPVTQFNFKEMREAVCNGAFTYPGANFVEDTEKRWLTDLSQLNKAQRKALSYTLLSPQRPKRVYRHLRNGDYVLLNRQPTLHRPSIMAHQVKVLDQKVIRLHYANCSSYNADFDGDEMNVHFPQNELARAEAIELLRTSKQYIVPTSGEPIRGLIQDHIMAAVYLTLKDTFFTREEYQELVYGSIFHRANDHAIKTLPPCIFKPKPLWTGKQVISTVMQDIAGDRKPLNIDSSAKIKGSLLGEEEIEVIVRDNELLLGMMDKSQFGSKKNGLVHQFYECYGPDSADELLTCLARLLTLFFQMRGFSCGLDDLLLKRAADKERRKLFKKAAIEVAHTTAKFVNVERREDGKYNKTEIKERLRTMLQDDKLARKFDYEIKSTLNKFTSEVIKAAVPGGQIKKFPHNRFFAMTESGAKGSMVNFSQCSSCLGLQEFEGRRIKEMISGKTLPSFEEYEMSPMANGYVASRFLTGIKPQEYFFHTMAGRDGLIDTTVKTARSGYLQRCLIKHLEGLSVQYDRTVRDNNGTVIQFLYGDDSVDPTRATANNEFKILIKNKEALYERYNMDEVKKKCKLSKNDTDLDTIVSKLTKHSSLPISEKYLKSIEDYIKKNPDNLIQKKPKNKSQISPGEFRQLAVMKYLSSIVDPGEPVGVIAGQSIGEPSTQMTLNTFHFAGLDVAHVTVGIPRLRQLLMIGSVPEEARVMTIPIKKNVSAEAAKKVANELSEISTHSVLQSVNIKQTVVKNEGDKTRYRKYLIDIEIDYDRLTQEYNLGNELISINLLNGFVRKLCQQIKSTMKQYEREKIVFKMRSSTTELSGATDTDDASEKKKSKKKKDDTDDVSDTPPKKSKKRSSDDDEEPDDDEEEEETMLIKPDSKDEETKTSDESSDEEDETSEEKKDTKTVSVSMLIRNLQQKYPFLTTVNIDKKDVKIEFHFPVQAYQIFMLAAIERASKRSFIRQDKGVTKTTFVETKDGMSLQMEGCNFTRVFQTNPDIVDMTRVTTNDIHSIVNTFGIEAGRAMIQEDLENVFKSYGITVDHRHLSLIADYLTSRGDYEACNRRTFRNRVGPLQKMSFETVGQFLVTASSYGETDTITGPSARLVFGRNPSFGTGSFDILHPLK